MVSEIRVLQFGAFTLDLRLRQLRRGEEVLPVTSKAFDLLAYMAANPERPLAKQELLGAVWPDSFVEEGNLSQNVFLLRRVLGSGPAGPIVTLPGRGYQFAAEVRAAEAPESAVAAPEPAVVEAPAVLEATTTRVLVEEETEEHISAWRSPWVIGLGAAGMVLLGVASWLGWQRWQDRVAGPPVQVVLADPEGSTGDPVLDRTLVDALRMELAQSPFVTVASPSLVRATLTQMMHKADDPLTEALARDVCERTGSQVVLRGEIARAGSRYLLTEQATSCADGSIVASRKAEAREAGDLPGTLDRLAAQLRHDLGESRRTIARFSVPLLPVNTGSLDALKDYSQALRLSQRGQFPEAIALLKQAVAADPGFATAWLDLANYSANMADHEGDRRYLQRAYELRETATAPVRLYIESRYAELVTGNLYDSLQQFRTMAEIYPRNMVAAVGEMQIARELGRHQEAAAAGRRALSLNPNFVTVYYGLCDEQRAAGQIAEARTTCESAIAHHLDSELVRAELFEIGLLQSDAALVAAQEAWSKEHPEAGYLKLTQALHAMAERRFEEGQTLLGEAVEACRQRGLPALAAAYRQRAGLNLARMGELDAARSLVKPEEVDEDNAQGILALVLVGHTAEAEAKVKQALQRTPDGTLWKDLYGPVVLAAAELRNGKADAAVERLAPRNPLLQAGEDLDLLLTRAEALRAAHREAEAQAAFREVVERARLEPVSAATPVAREALGQASR